MSSSSSPPPSPGGDGIARNDDACVVGADNFEIIKLLGVGSQGKVYLVRLKDTDKYYAMKVFKKQQIIQNEKVLLLATLLLPPPPPPMLPRSVRLALLESLPRSCTCLVQHVVCCSLIDQPTRFFNVFVAPCSLDHRFDPYRTSLPCHKPTPVHHKTLLLVP
jgi:serine/threonine protein kinase